MAVLSTIAVLLAFAAFFIAFVVVPFLVLAVGAGALAVSARRKRAPAPPASPS